ncbi:MAG: valine--tRNA ligase [Bacteroidota bacterium]
MSISKTYNPKEVEDKWYQYWLENQFFTSRPNPNKEPFTIVIPPPNVTGVLHMGHMLNNTIQDVLVRKARMEGKEACWVPGTDHASIATEAKVVAMLKEKGISKKDLSREEFLKYAWEWKEKYGGIILEQLKKLGASCDWSRTSFTMDPDFSKSVVQVFIDLHKKGLIYRGVRMVNWDPQSKTAVSDEEVLHKEVQSKLYYIRYEIVNEGSQPSPSYITIATTRPETILADTAICVNPTDERYQHLHGKTVRIPFINREIPIITDEYVTTDFGTGALKVTPAHDLNDYELGIKHNLPVIDILNDDGTLNEKAQRYIGEDRFAVRKKIAKDLDEAGYLEKIDDYKSNVGYSERTSAVIEPKLSMQWFLKMDTLAKPALENVMNDTIQLHPAKFKNMYRSWMENVKDWCISRQLWWGHQIPAYYLPSGEFVIAESKEQALVLAQAKTDGRPDAKLTANDLIQEPDVLDTWFSAWLWPISVFKGITNPDNEDINYYYPTNDLVTAPEILFFWVARMIVAGYEYKGLPPFRNVYLTGIVRDKQGRKMSKSLGNSPDPLDLIAQYGADAVRTGMLFSSPAGNDLPFDEKLCEQGSRFSNKIWNVFRLIQGWDVVPGKVNPNNQPAIEWFEAKFDAALFEIEEHFAKYRISDALLAIYKLIWDDFCAWYLEMVKPPFEAADDSSEETVFRGEIDQYTYEATIDFLERLMKVLHPYMPFLTEELWHQIKERAALDCICVAAWPAKKPVNEAALVEGDIILEVIKQIRNLRNTKQISPKVALPLTIRTDNPALYTKFDAILQKLANTSEINLVKEKPDEVLSFVIKSDDFFVTTAGETNVQQEKENAEKEMAYQEGFKESILKKLQNEKFVANAKPEIIEKERQKLADAEAKIASLQESLKSLGV